MTTLELHSQAKEKLDLDVEFVDKSIDDAEDTVSELRDSISQCDAGQMIMSAASAVDAIMLAVGSLNSIRERDAAVADRLEHRMESVYTDIADCANAANKQCLYKRD